MFDCGVPCTKCGGSTILVAANDMFGRLGWECCGTVYPSKLDAVTLGKKKYSGQKPPQVPDSQKKLLGPPTPCAECKSKEQPRIDHIVSRDECVKMGLPWTLINHHLNLQWLCEPCNVRKRTTRGKANPVWISWVNNYRRV